MCHVDTCDPDKVRKTLEVDIECERIWFFGHGVDCHIRVEPGATLDYSSVGDSMINGAVLFKSEAEHGDDVLILPNITRPKVNIFRAD